MKKIVLALSILTLLLYSCKDEDVIINNELASTQASQDHLVAEKIFNNIGRVVEDGFMDNDENKNCPSYTLINTNTTDQDTMIIDFGNGNPDCFSAIYNNLKRGKIIVIYTGKYRDSLSVMTTTFDNYHVNNNLVQGERIVTNKGININGNICFTIEVNNASINTSNGTINWESIQEREWVEGSATPSGIFDDSYSITGSASGNGVNGNSFTMSITEPLYVDLGCLPSCIIKSGKARKILIIGAETLSKIVDWKDRRTCVLFGDGAGAIVMGSSKQNEGVLSTKLYSDGSWHDSLFSDGGPSTNQKVGKIRMDGQDIFKQAVNKLSEATMAALKECNLNVDDINWFVPHQANQRIISSTAKKIGISEEKTVSTVRFHANTSAASIPLALSSSIESGMIKKNDILALCAIGGGLTWGSCILKI